MANVIEVKVPDIGDFKNIPVIEVLVKAGDSVSKEAPLVTLESDKATMEVPAPTAGTVKELKVKVGDKVSEGSIVLTLEPPQSPPLGKGGMEEGVGDGAAKSAKPAPEKPAAAPAPQAAPAPPSSPCPTRA